MYPGAHLHDAADRPAVVMAGSGFVQTSAELDAAANRLSRLLRARGLRPGDHVVVCLENHDRYLEVVWGCHYAGLVYTCASSRLQPGELGFIVNDSEAKALITSADRRELAEAIAADIPGVTVRLMLDHAIDGFELYAAAVDAVSPEPLPEPRPAGVDMLYSSGTTGRPKGVAIAPPESTLETTRSGITALMEVLFAFDATKTYLSPAPLYHAAPLRFCMAAHALGGTVVVMEHFDPERFLQLVEAHRVTHTQAVPTMFVRLLKLPAEVRASYDVSSLEAVIHAAAPCPVPVKQQMIDWVGPVVHEYYAGTEGNGFVYCDSEQWLAHPGTVGLPVKCIVHIVGEDGEDVAPGEVGTVYFEGGGTFEYHNDPGKTADARHPRGWTTLGDVGYLDDDGFLYLTDRKAYMIITGGVNVYPQEAENLLVTHPDVVDVAVFGVPDEDLGETVKAVVQPRAMPVDDDASARLERALIQFCRTELAAYKCPRSIDFRAELPRHPTGKLYKRLLKDEYRDRYLAEHPGAASPGP